MSTEVVFTSWVLKSPMDRIDPNRSIPRSINLRLGKQSIHGSRLKFGRCFYEKVDVGEIELAYLLCTMQ